MKKKHSPTRTNSEVCKSKLSTKRVSRRQREKQRESNKRERALYGIPLLQETPSSIKLHTYSLVSGHITREGQTRYYKASRNNFNESWIRESS